MFMAKDLLDSLDIHSILKHKGSRSMAELVGRILGTIQPSMAQMLFYQGVDCRAADTLVAG